MDLVGFGKGFMALNFSETLLQLLMLRVVEWQLDSHGWAIVTSNANHAFPIGIQKNQIFPIQFLDSWNTIPATGVPSNHQYTTSPLQVYLYQHLSTTVYTSIVDGW